MSNIVSDDFIIIDRRENPKGLSNRQRFLDRAKKAIRESAKKALGEKSMSDQSDTVISIPTDGIDEPKFKTSTDQGEYDYVLPGNEEYVVGDIIKKPKKKSGSGKGSGSGEGDGGEDDFHFAINYEEYLNVIFDDLELPDLIKKTEKNAIAFVQRRAGYTNSGMPSNLNVEKTAVAGMARRIALKSPKYKKIHELEAELTELQAAMEESAITSGEPIPVSKFAETSLRIEALIAEIASLRARMNSISYLDDVDLRYNNFVKQPKPITQAVMICIMDVSYSMGEREKIIAKKFFILLHLFLRRRYQNIDVVFVRHHDKAIECDEQSFFTSKEAGGTIVSTSYEKVKEIVADRYNTEDWNIYLAQASDGDNESGDNVKVKKMLQEDMLPVVQHFTYIEIKDPESYQFMGMFGSYATTGIWEVINSLTKTFDNISCSQIFSEREVVNVFRKLFKKDKS